MNIIPRPMEEKVFDGFFELRGKVSVISEIEGGEKIIERFFSGLDFGEGGAKIAISFSEQIKSEGYTLKVQKDSVAIGARDLKGVFYAVQTLRQLSGEAAGKAEKIPCCEIKDEPRFSYRGFMLDEARHFFGKDFVKKTLDMMALMKLNMFHWHLTDDQGWRVEIKKYPLLTQKGTTRKSTQLNLTGYWDFKEEHDNTPYGEGLFYTQEDIKEIVAYAESLNIEIIPEIDMPGHLTAAAACYPEITCTKEQLEVTDRWGVMDTIGCAGSEELYNFLFGVIDEVTELFPSKYFHIGGDEVPKTRWKVCPKCQAKIKELSLKDEEELQGAFNERIQAYLESRGKKIIGWNEILKTGNLDPKTIVQWWYGNSAETGVEQWVRQGNSVIITSSDFVYMDYYYSHHDMKEFYSMDYDTLSLPEEFSDGIIGAEAPMWTEYARDEGKFNFNVYPRMQALAEICWTDKKLRDFDDFNKRLKAFDGIYKFFGIVPAPESYYICEGPEGEARRNSRSAQWEKNPNGEYEKFLSENQC